MHNIIQAELRRALAELRMNQSEWERSRAEAEQLQEKVEKSQGEIYRLKAKLENAQSEKENLQVNIYDDKQLNLKLFIMHRSASLRAVPFRPLLPIGPNSRKKKPKRHLCIYIRMAKGFSALA